MDHDTPIVLWCGRFHSYDGYGTAAQHHVGALRQAGATVVAVDMASREVVGPVPDALVHTDKTADQIRVRAIDPARPIVAVVHERPVRFERVMAVGKSCLVGFSYWETEQLPADWASLLSSMDLVWAASDFNAEGFARSGVPRWMIDTVGQPVDPLLLNTSLTNDTLRTRWPEETVFLSVVSSHVGRRDLAVLFESFSIAFNNDDDVSLVLKVPQNGEDSVRETLETTMRSMPARR